MTSANNPPRRKSHEPAARRETSSLAAVGSCGAVSSTSCQSNGKSSVIGKNGGADHPLQPVGDQIFKSPLEEGERCPSRQVELDVARLRGGRHLEVRGGAR